MNDTTKPDKTGAGAANAGAGFTRWGVWLAALALFGGLALLLWSWSGQTPMANREPPAFSGEANQFIPSDDPRPAPQTPFTSGDGRSVTLGDFRGQVVLVNFWATWCIPCVKEMAALDRLQGALGDEGFTVLAISQDRGGMVVVRPFYDKLGLANLGAYLDPKGAVQREFAVTALPVSVVIDRQGREVGRLLGPAEWDSPQALALLRHYLQTP
jgi:thiol-disulfide isomerase/thioredoxin